MQTVDIRSRFEATGVLRLDGAFTADQAAAMREAVWQHAERQAGLRPDDPAGSFATVQGGLNKMTLRRFEAIMAQAGVEPVFRATDPGERPVLRAMREIARVPPLREYFTVGIYTIWRKPGGDT